MDRIKTLSDTKDTRKDGYRIVVYTVYDHYSEYKVNPDNYKGDPEADRYLREDEARKAAFGEEWYYLGVCVDIHRQTASNWADGGPVVGRASLWAIESDSGADYFAYVARELTEEAWAEVERLRAALADGVRE